MFTIMSLAGLGCIEKRGDSLSDSFSTGGPGDTEGQLSDGGSGGSDGGGSDGSDGSDSGTDSGGHAVLVGTGYQPGDVAYNLLATDQFGGEWALWDYQNRPVVLVVGSLTVGGSVEQMLEWLDDVDQEGDVVVAILLGYDETDTVADVEDAARTATGSAVTSVLIGDIHLTDYTVWSDGNPPKLYLIDQDMVIRLTSYGTTSESSLRAALSAL